MALMDKFQDAKKKALEMANSAAAKASETAKNVKDNYEVAKAEKEKKRAEEAAERERLRQEAEAHKNEMLELCEKYKTDILSRIDNNFTSDLDGFYNGKSKEEIFSYVKTFFEKILLPGNHKKESRILMYPYISTKQLKLIKKSFGELIDESLIVAYICDTEGQEFLLTYEEFYFKKLLEEDKAYYINGSVSTDKVSLFSIKENGDVYTFFCDDVEIANINKLSSSISDFITLDKFFLDMKNADYEITDEEVDNVIHNKIGDATYYEISNYFDDDNEKVLFFTWNLDCGYVACTNEHLIIADKKSGDKVSNISSFYYDEIKSIDIHQEKSDVGLSSNNNSLGDFLFDVALTSVMDAAVDSLNKDYCKLRISANGRYIVLDDLIKLEADRIIVIYNKFKKEIRKENKATIQAMVQPQVIVSNNQPDAIEQIKKLKELLDMGIITEEEFNQKKQQLLEKV